jgi:methionyl-tRNA formyltransferase
MEAKSLRIVFMGTPDFAVESLKALHENGYNIVGVVTVPDKPAGRGQKMHQSAVKQYAEKAGLPLLQPEKLKDENFVEALRALKADLQVVVAFRMLPEIVWTMPPLGTFNLHGSLLPRYRGAAPLNRAIINGDKETGVTTFLLKHEIDTGNILFSEKIEVGENETVGDIHDKLMVIGAGLVLKTVDALAENRVVPIPQESLSIDLSRVKAPKIFKDDCRIDWSNGAKSIHNLIRGLSPYPAAWTNLTDGNKTLSLKIFHSVYEIADNLPSPGSIMANAKGELKIACADGYIIISDLQLAGKTRMSSADFLRGFTAIAAFRAE